MINVRDLRPEDVNQIKEIHQKFYSDLEFPDFLRGFLCSFVITDEDEEIIIAGGLRPCAEILLFTDVDKSELKIGRALIEAKNASLYIGQRYGLNELLAFVKNNDVYARHLVRHGFYPRSSALAIKVPKWANPNVTKT